MIVAICADGEPCVLKQHSNEASSEKVGAVGDRKEKNLGTKH